MNTREKILEFNKRCALVIGGKKAKDCLPSIRENLEENDYCLPIFGLANIYRMKFHYDWNWIMAVVEAIEKLGFATKIDHDYCISNYGCDRCEIDTKENALNFGDEDEMEEPIVFELTKTKKDATVKAIDKFLIWHEQNK